MEINQKLTAIQGAFIQKQNKNKIWILVGTASFVTFQLSQCPYILPSSAVVLKTNSQRSRRKSVAWKPPEGAEQGSSFKAPFPENCHLITIWPTCLMGPRKTSPTRLSLFVLTWSSLSMRTLLPEEHFSETARAHCLGSQLPEAVCNSRGKR